MFEITGVNISETLKAIVMATGYENPLSSIHEIETKLSCVLGSDDNGEVLFDLTCSNGLEWNRFVSLQMTHGKIMLNTARIISEHEIPEQILIKQLSVLRSHPEYVEESVLTPDNVRRVFSLVP